MLLQTDKQTHIVYSILGELFDSTKRGGPPLLMISATRKSFSLCECKTNCFDIEIGMCDGIIAAGDILYSIQRYKNVFFVMFMLSVAIRLNCEVINLCRAFLSLSQFCFRHAIFQCVPKWSDSRKHSTFRWELWQPFKDYGLYYIPA